MTLETIFLLPGDYKVTRKPMKLSTLLGSCVSVCIYNRQRGLAAMNHFMLAESNGTHDVGRYGDSSTSRIIETLLALDPDPTHFKAHIYGGGAVVGHLGSAGRIGERNIEMARSVLANKNIAVCYEDVGGKRGRRLDFITGECRVDVNLIGDDLVKADKSTIRVLIVDDSEVVRKVMRKCLEGVDNIKVVGEACDAFEAREKILQVNPDVITLDIEMPHMDGLQFLEHLTKFYPKPTIIVSSTAKPGTAQHTRAQRAGARGFVDKESLALFRGVDKARQVLVPVINKVVNG